MIVFLSNESPWPTRSGGRVRTAGLIEALRAHDEVTVLVTRRYPTDEVDPQAMALPVPGRSRAGTLLGTGPRLGRGLLDAAVGSAVATACAGARALVVSQSYLAAELPPLPVPVIVDLQNIEAIRQASLGGLLGRVEAAKARRWEPRVLRSAAGVVCVDEQDAAVVRSWGARAIVVPNVAQVPPSPPSSDGGTVLAVADWEYPPNKEGLRYLLDEVQPLLPERIVLAGRGSDAHGGLGFVPDVAALYDEAAVVVSPVLRGAGTQLKIVEALTRGRVVVTTPYGARSVPSSAAEGCVVGDTPAQLAASVSGLLADPRDRRRREATLAGLPRSWTAAARPLTDLLAEVAGG